MIPDHGGDGRLSEAVDIHRIGAGPMVCASAGTLYVASNPSYGTRINYPVRRSFSLRELAKSGRIRIHHAGMHDKLRGIVTKGFA